MKLWKQVTNGRFKRPARFAGFVLAGGIGLLLLPGPRAEAQFDMAAIIAGLQAINSTIESEVVPPLQAVQKAQASVASYEQNYLYPLQAINSARQLAGATLGLANNIAGIVSLPNQLVNSYSSVNQGFERLILSGNASNMSSIASSFHTSFGTMPTATQMLPAGATASQVSALSQAATAVDMGDAMAQDSIQKAVQLDSLSQTELEVSQQLLSQLQNSAPGDASIIEAEAAAWNLQGHGYTQMALAQELRAQSALLAYQGVTLKQGSATNGAATGGLFSVSMGSSSAPANASGNLP